MIIDAMTTTHRNEYFRNLLEHQRLTLESVTEQRDRLAEAMRHFMTHGGHYQPVLRDTVANIAKEALQSLTPNEL